MKSLWVIFAREFKRYFTSVVAYVIFFALLFFYGAFFSLLLFGWVQQSAPPDGTQVFRT